MGEAGNKWFAREFQGRKSGTQKTQSAAEGIEKSAGHGNHGRKPEGTEYGMGVRSKSASCIPGTPESCFQGRGSSVPGITSGCAGSRLWRARAARATASSAFSVRFRVFRDQQEHGGQAALVVRPRSGGFQCLLRSSVTSVFLLSLKS